jgi:hypothetical protein
MLVGHKKGSEKRFGCPLATSVNTSCITNICVDETIAVARIHKAKAPPSTVLLHHHARHYQRHFHPDEVCD